MGDGGTCITQMLPPTFSANCKAGMATLSAIHFASMILARSTYYIHYQSQTGAWFWEIVEPTTEGRMWGIDSYLRWLHIFLLIRKLDYLLVAFLVLQGYDHLHNWWGSGGNTRLYSFGDANAYDLYEPIWILPKIQAGFEGGREIVCCNCRG